MSAATTWREGLSRDEQLAVSSYALGLLRSQHPDEVKEAIAYGIARVEEERRARARAAVDRAARTEVAR